jgi:O-methyltransferase
MAIKKSLARFLIVHCGFKRFHGGVIQRSLRSFLDEIDLQQFREKHACPSMKDRDELFKLAYESGDSMSPIAYLEFGVYAGESMRKWTTLSKERQSRFYGFDSFEGLPENWNKDRGRGFFDAGGNAPKIWDERVSFVKGWFHETVPTFVKDFNVQGRLIVHFDADLYSSTLLPLLYLDRFMTKGTMLIFDEFYDRDHEFKAFMDYQRIARRSIRLVGHCDNFSKVCIEIL